MIVRLEQPARHELLLLDRERLAAHQARVGGPQEKDDHDDDVRERRLEDDGQQDGDEDAGQREGDVDQAHEQRVDPAAEEPREQADEGAGGAGKRDADDRHGERDARAVQQPAQRVPAVAVGAERMPGPGALEPHRRRESLAEGALERRARREPRGEEPDGGGVGGDRAHAE
jgi:hypothetical protein